VVELVLSTLCFVPDTVPATREAAMPPTLLGIIDASDNRALCIHAHEVRLIWSFGPGTQVSM